MRKENNSGWKHKNHGKAKYESKSLMNTALYKTVSCEV